jgi:hypothetical protein
MRPTLPGEGTALHADYTFFAAHPRDELMVNAWIPLCAVPVYGEHTAILAFSAQVCQRAPQHRSTITHLVDLTVCLTERWL